MLCHGEDLCLSHPLQLHQEQLSTSYSLPGRLAPSQELLYLSVHSCGVINKQFYMYIHVAHSTGLQCTYIYFTHYVYTYIHTCRNPNLLTLLPPSLSSPFIATHLPFVLCVLLILFKFLLLYHYNIVADTENDGWMHINRWDRSLLPLVHGMTGGGYIMMHTQSHHDFNDTHSSHNELIKTMTKGDKIDHRRLVYTL